MFQTDADRILSLLETEAELCAFLAVEALETEAGEERPKYVANYIGSKRKLEDGDITVVSVGFEAMLRRIFFDDDGGAVLVAENKAVENLTVGADELVVNGKVVAVHRELE